MICSRINISHLLPCAEYSANNSFNYNGNNGKLNNNNKNNTYSVRPVLELGRLQTYFEDCPFPLSEIYDIYRITKKHKASKSKMEHYRRLNKIRYRQQLSISNAI